MHSCRKFSAVLVSTCAYVLRNNVIVQLELDAPYRCIPDVHVEEHHWSSLGAGALHHDERGNGRVEKSDHLFPTMQLWSRASTRQLGRAALRTVAWRSPARVGHVPLPRTYMSTRPVSRHDTLPYEYVEKPDIQ